MAPEQYLQRSLYNVSTCSQWTYTSTVDYCFVLHSKCIDWVHTSCCGRCLCYSIMLLGAWWAMQVRKDSVVEHNTASSIVYCKVYEDWHRLFPMIQEWASFSQYSKREWQVLTVCAIACVKLEATSMCNHMQSGEALLGPIIHFAIRKDTRVPCLLSGRIGKDLTQWRHCWLYWDWSQPVFNQVGKARLERLSD